jgi:hypothetical protein
MTRSTSTYAAWQRLSARPDGSRVFSIAATARVEHDVAFGEALRLGCAHDWPFSVDQNGHWCAAPKSVPT